MALKPIRISQLSGYLKRIIQSDPILGNITVIGEISNLKYHTSGHVYFTMKDRDSKLNCFLPWENMKNLRYELSDGMEITASGYINIYERGSSYSLNIRDISVEGKGNLAVAFEKLKNKLEEEGLFRDDHKKPIPFLPRSIVIITSPTGAAIQDMLKIIKKRSNITDVTIFPVLVQGSEAAQEIARAIMDVNHMLPETDVIIIGRGGGSLEELWAFNEEVVARSIFASKIPIISAVGHETDFTIADFTADVRGATPTEAAQIAVPDVEDLRQHINGLILDLRQKIYEKIRYLDLYLATTVKDLIYGVQDGISRRELVLSEAMARLERGDPSRILERGYSLATLEDGSIISSVSKLMPGDNLTLILKDGKLKCNVTFVYSQK
ncbi:MAG: exodeoxyribonuclease VII large subunit [Anaerovoracaceae bacterium]|jgi:exodeoxyribonuclease VII large subunit